MKRLHQFHILVLIILLLWEGNIIYELQVAAEAYPWGIYNTIESLFLLQGIIRKYSVCSLFSIVVGGKTVLELRKTGLIFISGGILFFIWSILKNDLIWINIERVAFACTVYNIGAIGLSVYVLLNYNKLIIPRNDQDELLDDEIND